ncbi:benzoate transporter [Ignatzschineria indica]|uniref:Benzoate transporter n=1 Tax=Ignatzschineria indica TaxID=472583 RepID=A0A2U2AM13_9GAMM|nr:benzoate/H(+) symporter BenE family transporter [Ignatzschineria indica]PWD84176.1 benzoate transporter [Ignatzschineria indica]GGZ74486.1 benzoate transporter [Ignatzschineria indica]
MIKRLHNLLLDWSLSATVAGFLAVIISYSGPLVIYFQAANVAGVSYELTTSWVWAVSIGSAIAGIILSMLYKIPIITAWSAPGTVLLVSLFPDISLGEVVGAYILTGLVMIGIGWSGYFDKLLRLIPQSLAAGLMAGVLFQFGLRLFQVSEIAPILVFSMMVIFLITKRFAPRYSIIWVMLGGLMISLMLGKTDIGALSFNLGTPSFTWPEFSLFSFFNLTIPLIIVTLSGQFLPGMMMIRVSGFSSMSAKPVLIITGIVSVFVAFFGGITIALASITAALCLGKEAHINSEKRYVAGVFNGVFYLLGAIFAGSIVTIFTIFPQEMIAALAGLALLGAIGGNLSLAMKNEEEKEAALVAFLVTVSGVSFGGISSVLWGSVFGLVTYWALRKW